MNRGLGRRKIFTSDADRRIFLELLGEATTEFGIEVHSFALLDNHYHLLVHTPEMGLSRAMRHIDGVYTQKFNWARRTDGPLFRGRYKARVVDSDEYLLELVRYIHLNPVEAGLVRHPGHYPWCSHKAYLEPGKRPFWLKTGEVLGRFGRTERGAARSLNEFVSAGVPEKIREALGKDGIVIGNRGFYEWIYDNFMDIKREEKEIAIRDRKPGRRVTHRQILSVVAFAYNKSVIELRRSLPGEANEARSVAVYLLRNMVRMPYREISKWMKVSGEYAVAKIQQRFKERLKGDKKLRHRLDLIRGSILSQVKT